jgi:hypothetical protein
MSKEHLWPVWMKKFLRQAGDVSHIRETHHAKWRTHLSSEKIERQGHLSTLKLRVVCRECNHGWMGSLEAEAKPVLARLIQDEVFTLTENDQRVMSRWITMKSITGEHAEPEARVTPAADRQALRSDQRIPDYFTIYVGRQLTDSDTAWSRVSQTLALSMDGPSPSLDGRTRNFQSISFLCGPLFVYVIAARLDNFDVVSAFNSGHLVRIWPIHNRTVHWPPAHVLSPTEMDRFAMALDEMKSLPNVRYGGDLPKQ